MVQRQVGGRLFRLWLGGGTALATAALSGLVPAPAQADEVRFQLRNGSTVCGTVLNEQGGGVTVQSSTGRLVNLRRDQILRQQTEACAPAASPSPSAAPAPSPSAAALTTNVASPATAAPAAAAAPAVPAPAATRAAAAVATPPAPAAATPAALAVAAPARELRFIGSDAMGPRLVPDLADAFIGQAGLRPRGWAAGTGPLHRMQDALGEGGQAQFRISVVSSITPDGYASLAEKRSDIAMAARAPNAREIETARNALGIDLPAQENVLALDGLAVIVHPENPVRRLTMEQIRDIFTGAIANWSEVGGPDRPIRLFAREPDSAASQSFGAEVMRKREIAASVSRHNNWPELVAAVADNPEAIGFSSMAFVGRSRALNLVAACGFEYEANEFTLRTQDYPLERRLSLYPGPAGNALADDFVRYALSSASYEVIQAAGYTSLQPMVGTAEYTRSRLLDASRAAPNSPDPRYNEAMGEYSISVRNALRLSTTFRFDQGSHQLDLRGQRDIERVATFLKSPEGQKYKVNVLGFTDSVGAFGLNRAVSVRRATMVADLLKQRGVTVHQVQGYASVAPVTCDEDPDAPLKNRRVEIWLSK